MKKLYLIFVLCLCILLTGCGAFFGEEESLMIQSIESEILEDGNTKITITYSNEGKLPDEFIIPKGYCFDGASIPRIFWRIIGPNTDNTFLVAAMVHDYLCENHSVIDNDRYLSTLIFNDLLEVGGVCKIKRWFMKHSVDNYQKFCGWKKGDRKSV